MDWIVFVIQTTIFAAYFFLAAILISLHFSSNYLITPLCLAYFDLVAILTLLRYLFQLSKKPSCSCLFISCCNLDPITLLIVLPILSNNTSFPHILHLSGLSHVNVFWFFISCCNFDNTSLRPLLPMFLDRNLFMSSAFLFVTTILILTYFALFSSNYPITPLFRIIK